MTSVSLLCASMTVNPSWMYLFVAVGVVRLEAGAVVRAGVWIVTAAPN